MQTIEEVCVLSKSTNLKASKKPMIATHIKDRTTAVTARAVVGLLPSASVPTGRMNRWHLSPEYPASHLQIYTISVTADNAEWKCSLLLFDQ